MVPPAEQDETSWVTRTASWWRCRRKSCPWTCRSWRRSRRGLCRSSREMGNSSPGRHGGQRPTGSATAGTIPRGGAPAAIATDAGEESGDHIRIGLLRPSLCRGPSSLSRNHGGLALYKETATTKSLYTGEMGAASSYTLRTQLRAGEERPPQSSLVEELWAEQVPYNESDHGHEADEQEGEAHLTFSGGPPPQQHLKEGSEGADPLRGPWGKKSEVNGAHRLVQHSQLLAAAWTSLGTSRHALLTALRLSARPAKETMI